MLRRMVLALLLILPVGCGRRVQPKVTLAPEELLYRQGIAAFQEATQEGYDRSASAFRKASVLKPARCDYALHLAESLNFLSRERRLNWEDFGREVSEAESVIRTAQQKAECATFQSFVYRLRALTEPDGPKLIERAIELDTKDPMNWLVQ